MIFGSIQWYLPERKRHISIALTLGDTVVSDLSDITNAVLADQTAIDLVSGGHRTGVYLLLSHLAVTHVPGAGRRQPGCAGSDYPVFGSNDRRATRWKTYLSAGFCWRARSQPVFVSGSCAIRMQQLWPQDCLRQGAILCMEEVVSVLTAEQIRLRFNTETICAPTQIVFRNGCSWRTNRFSGSHCSLAMRPNFFQGSERPRPESTP